jgi:hypothetical protein
MDGSQNKFDPELLQAQWVLGGIEPEELVEQAILALQQDRDCSALRQIAALSRPTRGDLGTLPDRVFDQLGLRGIDRDHAIKIVNDRGAAFSSPLISALVNSFPDFEARWGKQVALWGGKPAGSYNDMAEFVHFVVEDVYEKGEVQNVKKIFEWMEQALVEGDENDRNLIGLGFFETLQCIASWQPYGSAVFEQFLGPVSREIWEELRTIWRGKSSLADVIRSERQRNEEK